MVFQKEGIQYTGRIVAVPGDVVEITNESDLMVNESTVTEENIFYTTPVYEFRGGISADAERRSVFYFSATTGRSKGQPVFRGS